MQLNVNKYGLMAIGAVAVIGLGAFFMSGGETGAQSATPQAKPQTAQENWIKRCNEDGSRCEIVQSIFITRDEETNRLLEVVVAKSDDKAANMIAVTAPLGINLEGGVILDANTEDDQATQMPYKTCMPSGCLAVGRVESTLVEDMKKGEAMSVFFTRQDGQRIEVKLSLNGFTKAYDQL